jgi:hypothetical protein
MVPNRVARLQDTPVLGKEHPLSTTSRLITLTVRPRVIGWRLQLRWPAITPRGNGSRATEPEPAAMKHPPRRKEGTRGARAPLLALGLDHSWTTTATLP